MPHFPVSLHLLVVTALFSLWMSKIQMLQLKLKTISTTKTQSTARKMYTGLGFFSRGFNKTLKSYDRNTYGKQEDKTSRLSLPKYKIRISEEGEQ